MRNKQNFCAIFRDNPFFHSIKWYQTLEIRNQDNQMFSSPLEITYENYKNKECRTDKWEVKGCYNTKVPFKRGKLLVYWRHHIEWKKDRHSAFATRYVFLCELRKITYCLFYFIFSSENWWYDERSANLVFPWLIRFSNLEHSLRLSSVFS